MNLDTIPEMDIPTEIGVKQLLRDSVHYFGHQVFGYKISGHHAKILDHMLESKFNLTLISRGHGKSLMVSVFVTWLLVNNPNIRIIIVSDTDRKATMFLKKIKTIIETSPIIKEHYGNLVSKTNWTDHSFTLNTRDEVFTEPSCLAVGAGSGQITGMHANRIFIDDAVSFSSSRSQLQKDRDKDWFKTSLIPVLLSSGSISCVGTRYSPDDLYDMIINDLHYNTLIMPAINSDTGEALCEWLFPLNDRLNEDGEVVKKGLNTIKAELGSVIWSLQFMCDVSLVNKNNIIQYNMINYYDSISWEDNQLYINNKGKNIKIKKIITGFDPAISSKETADFSAFCVIGKATDGNLYCLDTVNKHLTFNKQIEMVQNLAMKWQVNGSVIEQVGYQESLIQELKRTSGCKIIPVKPTRDKTSRLMSVSGFFENGKVHFLKKQTEVVNQLLTFTGDGSNHDDLVDACVYALAQMRTSGSGMLVLRM
jgi:predicted phage terminase large subunit-like protein